MIFDETKCRTAIIETLADKFSIIPKGVRFTQGPVAFNASALSEITETRIGIEAAKVMLRYHKTAEYFSDIKVIGFIIPFVDASAVQYRVTYKVAEKEV